MGCVPLALLMKVPLKRLVALAFVETIAFTPLAAVTVEAETVNVPLEALFKTLYRLVVSVLLVMFIAPDAAFRMQSAPKATVPEEITQLSIEICPAELLRIVNEPYTATVLLIVDDVINTFPVPVFFIRHVPLSDDPPEITHDVKRNMPVEVLCNSTRPVFIEATPLIDISPTPLFDIVAKLVVLLSDIFKQFIEMFPDEEDVNSVAFEVVEPAKFVAFIKYDPPDAVNTPPATADVPPPTNDAVMAAFVMRATSTFVSMVTVKLLE